LGLLHTRVWDRSGIRVGETRYQRPALLSVYPTVEPLRSVPRPLRTQSSFGNYVAPRLGAGIEPGDRIRQDNWRASLRLGQLYVTQYHQERNADVVLLLDSSSDIGARPISTLDLSVRAAAALAAAYIARKDRVGLIEYGGYLRWIKPATGRRHARAIFEALVPADFFFTYVAKDLDIVPPRVLPRRALVIAISPLLDPRFEKALFDLSARGFDLVVLAISPVEPTRRAVGPSELDELASRLWALERQGKLVKLRGRGLEILEWAPEVPLEAVFARFARYRPRWAARR
jgi:uncharacterized protein (DUF58 family)